MKFTKVKELREELGLTQGQLSIKSGVSKSYISEIESGKYDPTVSIVCKLCKALKCTPNDLIDCQLECEGED